MREVVFRLLGPLDVHIDGKPLRPGGARQRTVLTMLLLSPGRIVSVDSLIEAVWPDGAPTTARNQIAICIAGLRKVFNAAADASGLIATSHPGYVLNPLDHRIDSVLFEDRVRQAREFSRGGRTADACDSFAEALSLWRGRAMDGIAGARIEQEAARLEELRLDVHEEYAGLRLQLGRHRLLIPELTALVAENPLREQARAHLMLAHYRSGRRADALVVYREGRRLLVDELGIEPGSALQGLHDLVLQDSPELTQPRANPAPAPVTAAAAQLPVAAASFTGRAKELSELDRMLDERLGQSPLTMAAISGIGGVGKTALAVQWANQIAARFPDGQIFADLRGYDEAYEPVSPATTLDRFLRDLGVPTHQIPADPGERAGLYRSVLGGKRVLIVLDNARSFQQIQPLLPGNGRCCVIITGRDLMDDLIGDYAVLRIGLNAMDPQEATALLGEVAGEQRIGADPGATERLGVLCDRLPLALRIAGARLAAKPHWSVRSLVTRLEDQRRRLDELSPGEGGVRAGFRLSYRDLPGPARQLYRRLGLLTVPDFAAWVGAALADVTPIDAEDLIEQLVDAQLLEVAPSSGAVTRYRFQDLLRLFALECAQAEESQEDREAALARAYGGWLGLADIARRRTYGGNHVMGYGDLTPYALPDALVEELMADPVGWLESERTALVDVVHQAAESDGSAAYAWALTVNSTTLFEAHNYLEAWRSCAEQALAAAVRTGDTLGEATMLRSLGTLAIYQRQYEEAEPVLVRSVALFNAYGEKHGGAVALRNLALCARFSGDLEGATKDAREALEGFRETGDTAGESHVLGLLAQLELERGNTAEGIALCTEAIAKSREAGSVRGETQNTYRLAEALLRHGDPAGAEQTCFKVLELTREDGDRLGEAHSLRGIGEARWRQGQWEAAEFVLLQALEVAKEVSDRFLRARIETDLGLSLAVRGSGDAVRWLSSARAVFEELGAVVWRERVGEALGVVTAAGAHPVPPDDLVRVLEG
ncbi:AfsR/SARP family transcriptional regulator [Streptomyces sp. NBC_01264]|uniref:AfsR/SARP family transcriptional regulator n=1 Tax=Streptomyces sp. NBC_01264 TaxID=2903804 RepID=UPI0022509EAD|nr:AfsR/SARP family transcriptional regulator [Streptomyces sp. NBC_01264]MCX4783691.1 tetratricopeptide repeat protein [Streptomyces sp. NBC_01264]